MRSQIKILTCGNVDDGKSTLIGHMLYSSKLIYTDQEKTLELESKIKNHDGIDYSLLLDGLDEEREQGITIDVAYKYFNTDKKNYIVLDSPGHEEYTRNMAVGASQADLAIILIDSTKGIVEQTKRHINICLLMGIKHFIVTINKMDLTNYSKEVYDKIVKQINDIFKNRFKSLYFIPVSATKGDNVSSKSKNMDWYHGKNLIDYLDQIEINDNKNDKFSMYVQRVCRPNQNFRGFQGNIASGSLKINDEIKCLPSNQFANVKQLFNLDKEVSEVISGQAVTVLLDKEIDISRGCLLTNDENITSVNSVNVTLLWMEDNKLEKGSAYYINIGTKSTLCYVKEIHYKLDINNDEKITTDIVSKNDIVNCDIEFLEKIPVTTFKYNKELGSLILINRVNNYTSACAVINQVINKDNDLFYHETTITNEDRARLLKQSPVTVWFTGLSCSGKSTIANELEKKLVMNGYNSMILDGDNVRLGINNDLGFSLEDRIENIRRVAHISKLINDSGIICLTAFITPLEINREMAKKIVGDKFVLVYVNTSIENCEKRDKKGLYKKARENKIKDFTGVNSLFEEPLSADIIVNNDGNNIDECVEKIYRFIVNKIKERP